MSESLPTPQGSRRGDEADSAAETASSRRQLQRPTELPPEIAAKLEKRKRFPRAKRWIFNVAVVLSLVLFVGNYCLWVRGILGHYDEFRLPRVHKWFCFVSNLNGQVIANCIAAEEAQGADWEDMKQEIDEEWAAGFHTTKANVEMPKVFQWFKTGRDLASPFGPNSILYWISIPQWFFQLLFAVLPLWWLWRWAERRAEKSTESRAGS